MQCLQNLKANLSNSKGGVRLHFLAMWPVFLEARLLTVSRIVPFIKLKCYQMLRYEAEQFKGLFVQHYMVETAVPCNLAIWTNFTPYYVTGITFNGLNFAIFSQPLSCIQTIADKNIHGFDKFLKKMILVLQMCFLPWWFCKYKI